ncbi:hypothetical protein Cycma_0089 [Cyclobacterium marinum DSM 745]|uniref:Uncharacterized protein n=2 Tax=Cyclobacterium marinum TaxID=104 RepID=G0J0F8_CYCMS|nr:hypothetical protein Cycma_0089 [Cyclobacterium marinum DSM 745]
MTQRRLEALHILLTAALKTFLPADIPEKLLYELVDKLNDRIRAKMKKSLYDNRQGYSLKLNSVEAKALYCWYRHIELSMKEAGHYTYEMIVANDIIHLIDKEYA